MSDRDLADPVVLGDSEKRRAGDPLLQEILWDLLTTTAGFLMIVTAVILAARGLSVG